MMTNPNPVEAAAVVLSLSGRTGFRVARVDGSWIHLRTPGAALNAADHVRRAGLDATARLVAGRWVVQVA
jgi:hypothetical protein